MTRLALALLSTLTASAPSPSSLTILGAASLRQPLEAASKEFEHAHPGVSVVVSTAATGVIAQQLEQGAPADVFIGAAREPAEGMAAKGLLEKPAVVARNRLVLALPAGSALRPRSLADLAQPGYAHLGLGNPKTVPAGEYALQSLAALHLDGELSDRFVHGESVSQVLALLKGGNLQAGFVYASDVVGAGGAVEVAFPIDDALHDPIVYPAAVVRRSAGRDLAAAFIAFLLSPAGQAHLARAGFLPAAAEGLEIAGSLSAPGRLGLDELKSMGPVEAAWNEHGTKHTVRGVPLDRVLTRFGFDPGPMGKAVPKAEKRSGWKKVLVASSPDGFQAVFSCAELMEAMGPTRALLVWEIDGRPLPLSQGPLRLVVTTDQEPSRSLYGIARLDVVDMRPIVPAPGK